jgi:phage repressor protein C with HTH and peptisase S24 domain
MEPTITGGSLVRIDHSKREISLLNGKTVAIRKDSEATIKRLRIVSKGLILGLPDNPQFMKEAIVLKGEQIDTAIIGKVVWWWGKQG